MTEVADLAAMDREALLALWAEVVGSPPPKRLSRAFLRRFLAFELQARRRGGLPAGLRAKLARIEAGQARPRRPALAPGARFLREWNGVTHVVEAVEGGYLYRGERRRSLSAIAREITGAHWSGPRFFGVPMEAGGGAGSKAGRRRRAAIELEATS